MKRAFVTTTLTAALLASTVAIKEAPAAQAPHAGRTAVSRASSHSVSLSARERLTRIAPASRLAAAVKTMQAADPSVTVTWLRGHVDAFSAHPRPSVPAYARKALEAAGLSTQAVAQTRETTTLAPKPAQNLDLNPVQRPTTPANAPQGSTPRQGENDGTRWYPQQGAEAARGVLLGFLSAHREVFELSADALSAGLPDLKTVKYGVGEHFRRLELQQSANGIPVLDGKTLVLFDLNWNVVSISRQLMDLKKLGMQSAPALNRPDAERLAREALVAKDQRHAVDLKVMKATYGIDPVRGAFAWQLAVADRGMAEELTVLLDGQSGALLHISDDTARYDDAKVLRWAYSSGNLMSATQVTSTGIYTHDDNTLVHDFFYLVNDDRTNGTLSTCGLTPTATQSAAAAYGSTTSSTYVRPTLSSTRDFSLSTPSASQGAFGESHMYYWGREYVQWQKQALVDLGLLTLGDFDNYAKALVIVNACDDGGGNYVDSLSVTTYENKGEGLPTIRYPERCRSSNASCSSTDYQSTKSDHLYTYQGNGGYHTPGVIQHELNHFIMQNYLDVQNSLDCSANKELKFFQEGGLGRTLPQMFWHNYYGVGFNPSSTDYLFRSTNPSGRVHSSDANLNHLDDYACADGSDDPYDWGGVVAQPMWEIYHGKRVDGSTITSMGRPSEDKTMIKTMYYAADQTSGSTFQDREELAKQFMEYWELFGTATTETKGNWCDAWDHHGVGGSIPTSYCN